MVSPFKAAAHEYAAAGLRPIPCGGENGKHPLVRWRRFQETEPKANVLERWSRQYPGANIGTITGSPSGVTLVDVDDPILVDQVMKDCGPTPIVTRTPRGGFHCWYRFSGEATKGRLDGAKLDVRAAGGFAVLPPSVRPADGTPYSYATGSLSELSKLPKARPGSLPLVGDHAARSRREQGSVLIGSRNTELFAELRSIARECDTFDELLFRARGLNEQLCCEPLSDSDVVSTTKGVWKMRLENRVIKPGERAVVLTDAELQKLTDPDAFFIYSHLRRSHFAVEEFPISPKYIRDKWGWGIARGAKARDFIVSVNLVKMTHQGGAAKGDWNRYRFADGVLKRYPE